MVVILQISILKSDLKNPLNLGGGKGGLEGL